MKKRALLILAMILGACSGPEDASRGDQRAGALELPPVGECTTLVGDLRLDTQERVETFGARTCTSVDGNVLITGVADLTPLSDLTSVTGALHIRGSDATTLAGLDGLTTVGDLVIADNAALTNVTLGALTSVGSIRVIGNAELTTLAIDALPTAGSVALKHLPKLSSLSLAALQVVTGPVHVVTTNLINLSGLSNLNSAGSLVLSSNDLLIDVTALSSLSSVTNDLVIRQHERLTSLGGFASLAVVGGRVAITANALLQDVQLSSVTSSEELFIHQNNVLSSTSTLNASYRADYVHIESNALLSSLIGLPLGPQSDLRIESSPALTSLDSIGPAAIDDLYIERNSGLQATTVPITGADYISVFDNAATSLTFPALAGGATLDVENNENLVSMTFGVLTDVDLYVFENFDLEAANFPMLATAEDFEFIDNPQVSSISAPNLVTANDDMRLIDTSLTDLTGFGSLQSVDDDFELIANGELLSVAGMESLATVGGEFSLVDNESLASVSGFSALSAVDDFTVEDNTSLLDCLVSDLAAVVTITGSTSISNNGGTVGCP